MAPVQRVATIAFLLVLPAIAQEKYIGKYDAFLGFAYLNSSKIALKENGIHFQGGMRTRTWMSMGFDYSRASGPTALTAQMLIPSLQQSLGAQMLQMAKAGMLPAGYQLSVPIDSTTQTFAAGPQLSWHRFRQVTLFARPSMGAMHEVAVARPRDAIARAIVKQLAPSGQKTDWTGFFGFGGGFEVNAHRNVAIRFQADYVWDHLFNDMLPWRTTLRFSVGPAFQFGKNILE